MHKLFLLVLIVLSLFSVSAIISSGYFPMHDDTQIARVVTMGKALQEGQFPVRWVKELGYGYGYPIFNFYGPLPYYVGGFLYLVGFSGLTATKIMFFLGALLPAIALYLVLARMLGGIGALVAAIFYVYAPYHAVQIYVRGAVGEYWILMFWPLILYGILQSFEKNEKKWVWGAVGIGGAIISHTLMGYVTALFFMIFVVLLTLTRLVSGRMTWIPIKKLFLMLLVGMGMAAFFWIPAFVEMSYTQVSGQITGAANFVDHFVCPGQLWNSLWGFGGSVKGCIDGMSFKLGKVHILASILAVILFFLYGRQKYRYLFVGGSLLTIGAVIFMLPISRILWDFLPDFSYLQYPWRFLSVASFGMAIITGISVASLPKRVWRLGYAMTLILSVLALEAKWFHPQFMYEKNPQQFESYTAIAFDASKLSDEYLPPGFVPPAGKEFLPTKGIESETGDSTITTSTLTQSSYQINARQPTKVRINTVYFPGWEYYVNEQIVIPQIINALPYVEVPEGVSTIKIKLTSTIPRIIGNIVSLVSISILIYYGTRKKAPIS